MKFKRTKLALANSTISTIAKKDSKTVQTSPKENKETKAKIELSIDRPKKKSAFSISSIKKKKELLKIINDNKPEELRNLKIHLQKSSFIRLGANSLKRLMKKVNIIYCHI